MKVLKKKEKCLNQILSGVANSVDPDQTAPWVYTVCICHFVRKFGVLFKDI